MTDRHARQLPLTPAATEKFTALAVGESMWIVRAGEVLVSTQRMTPTSNLPGTYDVPPAEFVQACAPCGRCGGKRGWISLGPMEWADCGICAIELVEPCAECGGRGWTVEGQCWPQPEGEQVQCSCDERPVTLGYAYAVGEPLPIVGERNDGQQPRIEVTDQGLVLLFSQDHNPNLTHRFAHYGQPESLVGQWAIEVRKA